ncbi:MAG: glycosyltransferase family 4 protein, partial [Acidobacteriota bacterium]|nr:glycosyltransferase family 4 protein [Acidobacteriota bacterium]
PTVLTLHDLSPWRNRAWHGSKGASTIRRRTPYLIPRATHIITPSEAIRREAIARFRIAPERITAIPLAASPLFRPAPQSAEPYFLFVGTQEPRKGLSRLLEAWRNTAPHIVMKLAGRRREDFPPIPHEPNLQQLGEVPDSALPTLYTNAIAVFYPSEYEGFGLPVLEAMQCGATVITSNDPALRELTAGAALHTEHLAEAFRAIPNLRDAALSRAANFSWERTAKATHVVYRRAMGLSS